MQEQEARKGEFQCTTNVETPLQTAAVAAYYVETAAVAAAVVLGDIAAALSEAAPVPVVTAAGNKAVAGSEVSDRQLDPAIQERWTTTTDGCLQLDSVVEVVDAGNASDVMMKKIGGVLATSRPPILQNYSY